MKSISTNKINLKHYLIFIIYGIVCSIGQTILLRELMVEVNGNEIIFSIFLSLWLFIVAFGSLLHKWLSFSSKIESKIEILLSILIILVPIQFLSIRILTEKLSLISSLLINIPNLILLAFIILTPGCLLIGYLFPLNCKLINVKDKPVHIVYILECIGIIIGGLIFIASIFFFTNFSILIITGIISFILLILHSKKLWKIILLLIFAILLIFSKDIFLKNYSSRYKPNILIFSEDSRYGRFDISQGDKQNNYFWNGVLFANSSNEKYAEEMVNFVLLQNNNPKSVLLIGGLLNGFVEEFLQNKSVKKLDYLELDKNIIRESEAFKKNISKVNFISDQSDAVRYLKGNKNKYDIIFIDFPDPASLFLNRFYTLQFFKLLKNHLQSKNSIAAITVSNSENYLLPELAELNRIIYNTFSNVFKNTIVIPAEKNIFIGSSGNYISNNTEILISRMKGKKQNWNWFNEALIFDTCNELRLQNFSRILINNKQYNTTLKPLAYISTIQYWAKHLDLDLKKNVNFIRKNKLLASALLLIVIILLSILFNRRSSNHFFTSLTHNMNIVSISLCAFVIQIILLYAFQIQFGYVYLVIAFFTLSFMVGLSAGFLLEKYIKLDLSILFIINLISTAVIFFLISFSLPVGIFFILNIFIASQEGLILAKNLSKKYKYDKKNIAEQFYFLDTIGATVGGFVFGVVFLPIYGISTSLIFMMFIVFLNIISNLISEQILQK